MTDENKSLTVATRAAQFSELVLPKTRLDALAASLPSHVKPERFKRNLTIALTQNPKLLNCNPTEVLSEVSKAAALGLFLDPQLGEAYLIVAYDGRAKREVPQLRIGYRGLMKLGRQSGEIANLYAHEVRARDPFRVSLGTDKAIIHEPNYLLDEDERGQITAYYAVVVFKDGTVDFELMGIQAIERIRDRSDGWKAYQNGKISSTPWATDPEEMSKKTVMRRLMKRLPQSPEISEALEIENRDYPDEPVVQRPSLRARLENHNTTGGFNRERVRQELEPPPDEEPPVDENVDEPGEFDEPKSEAQDAEVWDHMAWVEGTLDQMTAFKEEPELRKWWNIIVKGEAYLDLTKIDNNAAQDLRQRVMDYGRKLAAK